MTFAQRLFEEIVSDIASTDGVFEVDADARQDADGNWYVDIELDSGETARLKLTPLAD